MSIDIGKAKKVLSESFMENHSNVNEDDAKDLIATSLKKIKHLKEECAQNERLQAAKQIVKDFMAGYSTTIKYEEAKIAFLLEKIEEIERGDINPDSAANMP